MDNTKFDDILMGMLQHCEQVEPFLDAIFSFLARRTDFFRLMLNREDKMGFPPGVAEKMVLKIFKAYQQIVLGTKANSSTEAANKSSGARKKKTKTDATSSATLHELPSTSQSVEEAASVNTSQPATREEERNIVPPAVTSVEVETSPADQPEAAPPSTTTAACATPPVGEASADAGVGAAASASSESPSIPSHQEEKSKDTESQGLMPGKSDECYNGAVLDKYTWSQTIRDIDVRIPVSSTITKARDVGVEIKSSHLKVWLKKGVSPGESNTIVDGKLQRTIKNEESFWSLEPGNCILVNLEKAEERFWTAVLEGDAEIDKTKVDTTRDISDFDEQTQTDFQRVMFDHHQKLQGKPTSQEAKTHDLLKQAWNAKGSPFAGTEFDPSKVNVSPSYG